eukprot:2005255-Prymnesium_polylepis.2
MRLVAPEQRTSFSNCVDRYFGLLNGSRGISAVETCAGAPSGAPYYSGFTAPILAAQSTALPGVGSVQLDLTWDEVETSQWCVQHYLSRASSRQTAGRTKLTRAIMFASKC